MAGHKVDNGKREPEEGCPVSKSTTEDAEQPPCHEEDMGPRQNVVEDTKKTSRRITLYKLFKLMAYFWTIMGGGFCAEVFGPSLPDLTKQLGVDYERISYALSARYAGYSFGSVIAGLSLGQLHQHSDAIIAFCLVASSITFAAIPFSGQLWVTIILCGVFGTGRGFVAPALNNELVHLFREDAACPLHALTFGFSIGSLISPQVTQHFWSSQNQFNSSDIASNQTIKETEPRLEIPFSIGAGLTLSAGILLMCTHMYEKCRKNSQEESPKERISLKKSASLSSCSRGSTALSGIIFALLFVYFFSSFGAEKSFSQFLYSFSVETEVSFSSDAASLLQTTFWVCATCGRFICMVLSIFFSARYTLGAQCILMIISSTLLTLYGHSVPMALWVCTGLYGMASTIAWGNGLAWASQNLNLNVVAFMVFFIASGFGSTSHLYIVGTFFDEDPHYLGYVMIIDVAVLCISFILMEVLAWMQRQRTKEFSPPQPNTDDNTHQ